MDTFTALSDPTRRRIVETLASVVPVEYEIVPFPSEAEAIDIGDYSGAFDKFEKATGWRPATDLRTGLEKTVAWYRG